MYLHEPSPAAAPVPVPDAIFRTGTMREIVRLMEKVARCDGTSVLIQGESGTGKEVVARWVHNASPRAASPFVAVNCAAIPATLMESEMFGHEKGAFTDAKGTRVGLIEQADEGTLFLDEIGDMEFGMQAKLLRFLEERTFRRTGDSRLISVDVRVISATNRNLSRLVEDREFREDLYYRLNVVPIYLPPLRARRADILPIARHFMAVYGAMFHKTMARIDPAAEKILLAYHWPGNIRELKNVIEREVLLAPGEVLTLDTSHLQNDPDSCRPYSEDFRLPPGGVDLEEVEKELFRQALVLAEGNQVKAARKVALGVDAFRYRIKKLGLAAPS